MGERGRFRLLRDVLERAKLKMANSTEVMFAQVADAKVPVGSTVYKVYYSGKQWTSFNTEPIIAELIFSEDDGGDTFYREWYSTPEAAAKAAHEAIDAKLKEFTA
jgi:hypothetical protein